MSFFPKICLRTEVEDYLRNVYHNTELVATLRAEEAEKKFVRLQNHLSHPPSFTTVRVNTRRTSVENAKQLLGEEIHKQFPSVVIPIHQHPQLNDLLLIPVIGPRRALKRHPVQAIVGAQCGSAVLRGAHVYSAGIQSASKWMKVGDEVSVYSDIEGRCKRGATEFEGTKVFIGNGISELTRAEIFCSTSPIKSLSKGPDLLLLDCRNFKTVTPKDIAGDSGLAAPTGASFKRGKGIRMTEPVYLSPSFDNVLPGFILLQNLPSAVVSHVLNPQPGERVLDMCAAPGGKTTHIAALMNDQGTLTCNRLIASPVDCNDLKLQSMGDSLCSYGALPQEFPKGLIYVPKDCDLQGEVIAMDKIAIKVEKIKQKAAVLQLNSIQAYCYNSTKAVTHDTSDSSGGTGPPFPPESFDRVLLDAPCSGMGQRPQMACALSLKELTSYPPLQRKLFSAAVSLLKPGGTLVYSTCTITLSENEEQVAWALKTFPCLQLQAQEPPIGGEGMAGAGLSPDQLKLLQRFDPSLAGPCNSDINDGTCEDEERTLLANSDTIGFFIAKFIKNS